MITVTRIQDHMRAACLIPSIFSSVQTTQMTGFRAANVRFLSDAFFHVSTMERRIQSILLVKCYLSSNSTEKDQYSKSRPAGKKMVTYY